MTVVAFLSLVHADTVVVSVSGELDAVGAPLLRQTMRQAVDTGRDVVVDLGLVTFVNSSAMGVFLDAHAVLRASGRRLALTGAQGRVAAVLQHTGLGRVLGGDQASLPGPDPPGQPLLMAQAGAAR